MKFSAEKASRKWPCGGLGCDKRLMVTAAVLLLALVAEVVPASARSLALRGGFWPEGRQRSHRLAIPLPKPRPAEAPAAEDRANDGKPGEASRPAAEQAAPAPPPPSACRMAL